MPTLKPNHRQVLAAKAVDGKRRRYMIEGVQGIMLDVAPRVRHGISRSAARSRSHARSNIREVPRIHFA